MSLGMRLLECVSMKNLLEGFSLVIEKKCYNSLADTFGYVCS